MEEKDQSQQFDSADNPNDSTSNSVEGKDIAIIAHLTIIGLIIAYIMNREKQLGFATFHIKNMIGLCIIGVISFLVSFVPIIGWLVGILINIAMVVLWLISFLAAINGERKELPIVGKYVNEYVKNIY